MEINVKATVILEFDNDTKESVTIDGLQVIGSWFSPGQGRPIFDVRHVNVNGVYQHHNVGVALLDLLRVAIIDLDPEWCKSGPGEFPKLARSTVPVQTKDIGDRVNARALHIAEGDSKVPRCVRCHDMLRINGTCPTCYPNA